MRASILMFITFGLCQSVSPIDSTLTASDTSTYDNSSPSSNSPAFSSSGSSEAESRSVSSNKGAFTTTDPNSLYPTNVEKLVTYTTKQKTVFIASCGGTFILLIALAILSGMSDTIARSRQKNIRTHA